MNEEEIKEMMFQKEVLERLQIDDFVTLRGLRNFQGNVISVNLEDKDFTIWVTHSDNERAIGETVCVDYSDMGTIYEGIKIETYERPREVYLSLIDYALKIRDKKWFTKLTNELNAYDKEKEFKKSRRMVM